MAVSEATGDGLQATARQSSVPLAWVIIGGLISSTFVARIVTPAIYKLILPAIEPDADAAEPSGPDAVPAPARISTATS